jgi:signal transduction histidine kinase/ActR/RegA family two-component response regulator
MIERPERILREVLALSFRSTGRAVGHGAFFSAMTIALMWEAFPHAFLLSWLAAYYGLLLVRARLAAAFLARDPGGEALRRWSAASAAALGATGIAWGALGAAAIAVAPETPLYALWIVFLVGLFAVLQTHSSSAHPASFHAFVVAGMTPIVAASIALPSPHYWVRLLAEAGFLALTIRVGRAGNRYVAESIGMRFENLELLREATAQKDALARQKDELDRANAAKTRFLAAASHDLRQPMQALALLVEGLRERTADPSTRRIVESISSSVAALSALLNEILDISRFDAGTVRPVRRAFPLSRVLERLRADSSQAAAQRGLSLRIRPCEAVVDTDEVILYRILANFVDNALRYTTRGGVLVGCRRRVEGVSIQVWDTGCGVPADQLDAIFLEFHQVGNPHRDREQGLGLGLAIVERAARVLGHRLDVRSRPGRGSMFSITVPHGDAARVEAPEGAAREPLEGCAVLVVEDDRQIRDAMTLLLEQWKCRVATAASEAEVDGALARLGVAPDMVIADYRLPEGRTGLHAIAQVRARHPRVAAAITTGDVSAAALLEMQAANLPILHKPLRPARLRALLGAALSARGAPRAAQPEHAAP